MNLRGSAKKQNIAQYDEKSGDMRQEKLVTPKKTSFFELS